MPTHGTLPYRVCEQEAGERLDRFLASHLHQSRNLIANLIRKGYLRIADQPCKPGTRISAGDIISGFLPAPPSKEPEPEPITLNKIYEDDDILVINKPPGLIVHPAPGHPCKTLVNGLLYHCPTVKKVGDAGRPGIVHRLDKDTSGAMVVAKTPLAYSQLQKQFKKRSIRKTYLVLVHGCPEKSKGTIDLPIGRHPVHRKKMSVDSPSGREAITHWQLKENLGAFALLTADIHTGRTHQIRVHSMAMDHPVIGDPVYRRRNPLKRISHESSASLISGIGRQMLHAWRLGFSHPINGQFLEFEVSMPQDMQILLEQLRSLYR